MAFRSFIPVRLPRARRLRTGGEPSRSAHWRSALRLESLEERRLLAVVTFAQFLQRDTAAQNFAYTNQSGTSATFNNAPSDGNPVAVTFDQDLAHGLLGVQNAHLFLTSSTTEPAQLSGGELREHFPTPTNTLQILLDNPPDPARRNFLTVTYSDVLSGGDGSQAGNLRASDSSGDTVNYSSDWFDFRGSSAHSFALSFSSIISDDGRGLHQGDGGFYHTFAASGTGTFDTNFPVGAICGQKFNDLNGNGQRDPGEPGLPGWTIRLDEIDNPDPFEQLHVTTTTDATGNYCFNNLPAGLYRIREVNQAGWLQTTPDPDDITVRPNVTVQDVDFGNFRTVSVSGVKFHNHDGNGIRNPGDEGLSGWTIQLVDAAGTIRSTTTGADGSYNFDAVGPGTYTIQEVQQAGWLQTAPVPPGTYTITTSSGSDIGGRDFGNFQLVTISGVKFHNHSGNGVRNPGDEGLSGWTIQLVDAAGTIRTANTGADGSYSFTGVGPGTYAVREVQQAGWVQTAPTPVPPGTYTVTTSGGTNVGGRDFGNFQLVTISGVKFNNHSGNGVRNPGDEGLGGWMIQLLRNGVVVQATTTASTGNYSFNAVGPGTYTIQEVQQPGWVETAPSTGIYTVTVAGGQSVTGRDFGNFRTITISGMKFEDLTGSGSFVIGDPRLPGWTIQLLSGSTVVATTTTDDSGNYSFTGIGPGTYIVQEMPQQDWIQTAPASGTYAVTTSSGTNLTGRDFGNFHKVTVSGLKFNDLDGSGRRDPSRPLLAGWTIRLLQGSTEVARTTTDVHGEYVFRGIGPGTYTVAEMLQAGWIQTFPAAPGSYTFSIISGQNVSGRDFGNFRLATIRGQKFNDLNGDGIQDPGEPGLPGWVIHLHNTGTGGDVTTTTDSNGNFTFTNVGPGNYVVSEELQPGWMQTLPGGAGTYPVATTSGMDLQLQSFGNFRLVTIGGRKFNDLNGRGADDPGAPPVPNWRIRLINSISGQEVTSTTTDANGNYTFTNVRPGTYTVSEVRQSGWVQTFPVNLGDYTFTVSSGQNVSGKNFGNFQLVTISGLKWNDLNGDGVRQPGEPALPGWTIQLVNGSGVLVDSRVTDGAGNYSFTGVGPGTYTIREVQQAGWRQTAPAAPGIYTVTVNSGQNLTSRDFGNITTGSIGGIGGETSELIPVFPSSGRRVETPNAVGKVDLFANRMPGSGDMQAQAVYVSGLYQSLLNRDPDINGLNHWVQMLQAGVNREEVARDIWQSQERRGLEVDHFYVTLLNRPADFSGRAFWVSALVNGATDVDVMRRILASDEYTTAHRSDLAFVTDLYAKVLGRAPDQAGQDGWLRALQSGTSREAVAQAFLTSVESDRRVIEQYYAVFLNRPADRGGEDAWLASLLSGRRTFESVGEAILASDEYFARLTRG